MKDGKLKGRKPALKLIAQAYIEMVVIAISHREGNRRREAMGNYKATERQRKFIEGLLESTGRQLDVELDDLSGREANRTIQELLKIQEKHSDRRSLIKLEEGNDSAF